MESFPQKVSCQLLTIRNEQLQKENEKLKLELKSVRMKSCIDSVVRCFNRDYAENTLPKIIAYHHRYRFRNKDKFPHLSAVLLDVRYVCRKNLPTVRIMYGVYGKIHKNIRKSDITCKYNQNQFLLICPDTELENAQVLGKMLTRKITKVSITKNGETYVSAIKLNFGVSSLLHIDSDNIKTASRELLRRAEKDLKKEMSK